jgi:hypothetical protein
MKIVRHGAGALLCCVCCTALAQTVPPVAAVASMPVSDAKVSGGVEISGHVMRLATGSTVEAGQRDAELALAAGGTLKICMNSAVHLAAGANSGEMMYSLDRGAMEVRRSLGEFSDVIVTPDLRILLSGPGAADVKVHTNPQGDTCIDNAAPTNSGQDAPYVTVTEQLGAGVYRVQPGQRVMLEHGSVSSVVDNEKEPCGCPSEPASATDFPVAQSEGLAPAPPVTQPAVPPGQVHAQATVPFIFDAAHPPPAEPAPAAPPSVPAPAPVAHATAPAPQYPPYLWDTLRHLYHRMFGKKKSQ